MPKRGFLHICTSRRLQGNQEGLGGGRVQPVKTSGPAATAPAVPTAVPTPQPDGRVSGTLCKQCDQKERYREDGKVHPYCSKTCAKVAIGKKIGQPKQDAKLSNNAMVQEEDTDWMCSNYMAMAGISHVEMSEAAAKLGFVAGREPPVASVYPAVFMTFLQTMGFIPTEDFS